MLKSGMGKFEFAWNAWLKSNENHENKQNYDL